MSPLLLAREQDEADGPPRSHADGLQGAGGFQDGHAPGPVVGRAGAEVPAIQVGAEDHDLVGPLDADQLGHRVIDLDRPGTERVGQVDLDLDRPVLPQPPDQAVRLARQDGDGERAGREVGDGAGPEVVAAAVDGEQAVFLAGVDEQPGGPFLDHQGVERLPEGGVTRRVGEVGRVGLRVQGELRQPRLRQGRVVGVEEDPGPLQPAPVGVDVRRLIPLGEHDRAPDRPLRRPRPARRIHQKPLVGGLDHPTGRLAAGPCVRDLPGLQVRVLQPVTFELPARPLRCRLELLRTGHPRADPVAEVFQVGHQLGMRVDLRQDPSRRRGRVGVRRPRTPPRVAGPCPRVATFHDRQSASAMRGSRWLIRASGGQGGFGGGKQVGGLLLAGIPSCRASTPFRNKIPDISAAPHARIISIAPKGARPLIKGTRQRPRVAGS